MKARTIKETFRKLKAGGKAALMPYIMAGDPDLARSGEVLRAVVRAGADIIELGMPFSDPLADGPAIQSAGLRALKHHVTCEDVFGLVKEIRKDLATPIVLMTYYNLIFVKGVRAYVTGAAKAGVSGLIVPDLPMEESEELEKHCRAHGLDLIFLAAPTSSPERVRKLAEHTNGFLYYVSRTGVTGARKTLPRDLTRKLKMLRENVQLPVAVGFGIKDAHQAKTVAKHADGVIIGSAIVKIIEEYGESEELIARVEEFTRPIAEGVHGG